MKTQRNMRLDPVFQPSFNNTDDAIMKASLTVNFNDFIS